MNINPGKCLTKDAKTLRARMRLVCGQNDIATLVSDLARRGLDWLTRRRVEEADQVRNGRMPAPELGPGRPAYAVFVFNRSPISMGVLLPVARDVD